MCAEFNRDGNIQIKTTKMKSNLHMIRNGLFLLSAMFCATPAAKAVTLADLLQPGAQLLSGDKVFFGFHNATQQGDLNVPLTEIFVDPILGGPGTSLTEYGIRFSSAQWSLTGPNMEYDFGLDFHVRTLSGEPLITDNTLKMAGDFSGDGRATIAESVVDALTGRSLATKMVFMDKFGQSFEHHKVFPGGPYAEIEISKDFAMTTGSAPDSRVTVRNFDQTFSQTPTTRTVPEGGPGLLATFCVMGLLFWVSRERLATGAR
jgi:hypothetical protein